ncbi:hypothetical protein H0X06_03830 [Candidatus Dependentiae bacterium]|nr:hypothetical protein [Candidatus Dependentiae bacterium]
MNKIRYCALVLLTSAPLCQGAPTTASQAQHACLGTLKTALTIGSAYFAYALCKKFPADDLGSVKKGMGTFAHNLYKEQKITLHGTGMIAYANLIGCSLYVAYKSGLSACESFKKAYTVEKPAEKKILPDDGKTAIKETTTPMKI